MKLLPSCIVVTPGDIRNAHVQVGCSHNKPDSRKVVSWLPGIPFNLFCCNI